jgi:SET domain-containing protein
MHPSTLLKIETETEEFTSAGNAPLRVANVAIKGRGVFATTAIQAGDLIEESPSWGFTAEEARLIDQTGAFAYYFVRNDRDASLETFKGHFVFGLISIVNHSSNPNAKICWRDRDSGAWASIVAIKDILAGEEITHKYTNIDAYSESEKFID